MNQLLTFQLFAKAQIADCQKEKDDDYADKN